MDAVATTRKAIGRLGAGATLGLLAALGGCTAARIEGTAIRGEIGRAILVTHSDPRLSEGGVGGVKVEITTAVSGRGGEAVLASGTTDEQGAFSIPVRGKIPPRVTIRASKDGEYDVRSTVARPVSGERMLILMRPPRTP